MLLQNKMTQNSSLRFMFPFKVENDFDRVPSTSRTQRDQIKLDGWVDGWAQTTPPPPETQFTVLGEGAGTKLPREPFLTMVGYYLIDPCIRVSERRSNSLHELVFSDKFDRHVNENWNGAYPISYRSPRWWSDLVCERAGLTQLANFKSLPPTE